MNNNDLVVTLFRNQKTYEGKKVSINKNINFAKLLNICSEILAMKAKRIFRLSGKFFKEIDEVGDIEPGDQLFVSEGEDFPNPLPNDIPVSKSNSDEFNVAIMGSAAVGKSCITLRYVQGIFVNEYNNTLEDKFKKVDTVDGRFCKLDILDTSGEDEYIPLRTLWMRNREGFIFVFGVERRKTLEDLDNFYRILLLTYPKQDVPLILVANKVDLHDKRQITYEEGMTVAQRYKAEYFEVSAKSGYNIDKIFTSLIRALRVKKELKTKETEKKVDPEPWWKRWCSLI